MLATRRGVCGWVSCPDLGFRRAIKRLSERLGIAMPVESMIDQFGKTPGNEFIHRYLP